MSRRSYAYSTGEAITNEHLAMLGDDVDTSIDALQETSLLFHLNRLQRAVANLPLARMKVGTDYIMPTGVPWDFLDEEKGYKILADTSLAATIAAGYVGNVAIAAGTDWDETNGAMMSYDGEGTWDYIGFASRTGNTLSTLSDVGLGNAEGDSVSKLYKLPTDFWDITTLHVDTLEYNEVAMAPGPRQFARINGFLWLMKNHGATTATMKYQQKVTDLGDIAESMSLPTEFDLFFVEMLNARAYRLNGNPQADIDRAHNEAKSYLLNAMDLGTVVPNQSIRTVRGPFRSPTG